MSDDEIVARYGGLSGLVCPDCGRASGRAGRITHREECPHFRAGSPSAGTERSAD